MIDLQKNIGLLMQMAADPPRVPSVRGPQFNQVVDLGGPRMKVAGPSIPSYSQGTGVKTENERNMDRREEGFANEFAIRSAMTEDNPWPIQQRLDQALSRQQYANDFLPYEVATINGKRRFLTSNWKPEGVKGNVDDMNNRMSTHARNLLDYGVPFIDAAQNVLYDGAEGIMSGRYMRPLAMGMMGVDNVNRFFPVSLGESLKNANNLHAKASESVKKRPKQTPFDYGTEETGPFHIVETNPLEMLRFGAEGRWLEPLLAPLVGGAIHWGGKQIPRAANYVARKLDATDAIPLLHNMAQRVPAVGNWMAQRAGNVEANPDLLERAAVRGVEKAGEALAKPAIKTADAAVEQLVHYLGTHNPIAQNVRQPEQIPMRQARPSAQPTDQRPAVDSTQIARDTLRRIFGPERTTDGVAGDLVTPRNR